MATIAENKVQVGEWTWFYREATPDKPVDKPPVVCLHGLPAQSYSWRNILPAIAEPGFRAIAPDWLGMGFSSKADARSFAYTPDAYVRELEAFLDALEIQQCTLVVQGFVGSAGIQFALRNPDRVSRLAILNAPISTAAKLPWKIKQLGLPLVGEMLTQDPLLVDRTLEGGGPYQVDDADLDVYRRPFLASSDAGRSLFITVRKLQLPQVTQEIQSGLQAWEKPTLLAWGMSDPWLPFELAEETAKALSDVDLVKLEKVGHFAQEDWAEKVADVLIPFLRRQPR